MKTYRLAFPAAICLAAIASAHANDVERVALVCPDRSLRMADIELAANAAHWKPSQDQSVQMLERARSVCAVGLSVVTLRAPTPFVRDAELAAGSTR